jgi:hypothetical protein
VPRERAQAWGATAWRPSQRLTSLRRSTTSSRKAPVYKAGASQAPGGAPGRANQIGDRHAGQQAQRARQPGVGGGREAVVGALADVVDGKALGQQQARAIPGGQRPVGQGGDEDPVAGVGPQALPGLAEVAEGAQGFARLGHAEQDDVAGATVSTG